MATADYKITREQLIARIRDLVLIEGYALDAADNDTDAVHHATVATMLTTLGDLADAKRIKTPQIG